MKHKLLWAVFALPLEVWIPVEILRRGDPIVAGLLMVVIAFLAATAAVKKMTPWGLIKSTFRWSVIVLLIFGGAIVSVLGMLFYGGKMVISSLPWPLIALATGIYLIPLTIGLGLVRLHQMEVSSFWGFAGIAYVALLVLVLWRSNK